MHKQDKADVYFKRIIFLFGASIPSLLFLLLIMLISKSWLSIEKFGLGFVISSFWDPMAEQYGALPFIYGTIMSSLIALVIAVPLGMGCAVYLSEVSKNVVKEYLSAMVELLAAIPSVVYGLWGIFVLAPWIATFVEPGLQSVFGFLPIFQGAFSGLSMLSGGVILAIMILPIITALSREIFQSVPNNLRESAMALGATKWETLKLAVMGPARSGIIGAIILALGRAMGETMAVTMVIGNRPDISASLFQPGYTLASVIANEFAEAVSDMNLSVLIELGLVLLVLTLIVNAFARILIWKTTQKNLTV
jgi:phosphate transport system permease protein